MIWAIFTFKGWDKTRFKTNPLQSAAYHNQAQGLVIIAKRWSQISRIIFFEVYTIPYLILTINIQINVYVYQKSPSLLHLGKIQVPLCQNLRLELGTWNFVSSHVWLSL